MIEVSDGPRKYRLDGRVAAMVRWLAEQSDRVNRNGKFPLRVEFHCGGDKVQPKVFEDEEPIRVE